MSPRPIGYWIKLLDRLIDEEFDRTIGEAGLGRRHWQVLNVLDSGPTTAVALREALAPFLASPGGTDDRPGGDTHGPGADLEPVLADLRTRGWLRVDADGRLARTEHGGRAFEDLRARVHATRAKVTAGVTPESYRTTVDTLARMCANLNPHAVC
jgi:hypothetical protein